MHQDSRQKPNVFDFIFVLPSPSASFHSVSSIYCFKKVKLIQFPAEIRNKLAKTDILVANVFVLPTRQIKIAHDSRATSNTNLFTNCSSIVTFVALLNR